MFYYFSKAKRQMENLLIKMAARELDCIRFFCGNKLLKTSQTEKTNNFFFLNHEKLIILFNWEFLCMHDLR